MEVYAEGGSVVFNEKKVLSLSIKIYINPLVCLCSKALSLSLGILQTLTMYLLFINL